MNIALLWQRWIDTITRERLLIGASLFRIVAGLTILYQYLINYHQRFYLYGPQAVWPYDKFLEKLAAARSFSLYALSPAPWVFDAIFHLGILVTILWVLGWHTRLMTLLTYIFLWSLHERNPTLWDGGDNVLQIVLVYAIFANLGAYFSLDASRQDGRPSEKGLCCQVRAMLHNAALLAFALQLCIVYATAGLYKVQGEMWQSGTALYYIMRVDEFTWPGYSEYIYKNVYMVVAMSYLTVAFQVGFPLFLFLNKWTRRMAILLGFGFHLGIALFMGLVTFSAFMMSIELALITDDEYRTIGTWLRRWRSVCSRYIAYVHAAIRRLPIWEPLRVQVFYDGWCPFCRRSIALLQSLDLFGLLEPISFRTPDVPTRYPVDPARAEMRMQACTRSSPAMREGIDAVMLVVTRLPWLWPILPGLWLARRIGVGQQLYDWLAARRTIIPSECTTECVLDKTGEQQCVTTQAAIDLR